MRLYARLVPRKCRYDDRTKTFKGKGKVLGRIAGQMSALMYALLKHDAEVLSTWKSGSAFPPPEPVLYDPAVHRGNRDGQYRPLKRDRSLGVIAAFPLVIG